MTYKPYPAYKDSGVEWLGKIPEGWEVMALRHIFFIKAGGDINEGAYSSDSSQDYPFPIFTNSIKSEVPYGFTNVPNYQANSITVTGRGEVGIAKYRDCAFDAIIRLLVLSPKNGEYCKYFEYVINSMPKFIGGNTAVSQLSTEQISPYRVPFPPLPTQKAIAAFLDDKTSRIDGLIKDYEELIALLREKRQALISHAVTRGLSELVPPDDPEFGQWAKPVKFVDSGVEWLGEIPDGWEVKRLKYLVEYLDFGVSVNASDIPTDESHFGVLKTSCVYGDVFKPEENKQVWENEEPRLVCPVKRNTIIVTRMNTPDLVGSCGYVDQDYPRLFLPDRMWQIQPSLGLLEPKYCWYFIISVNTKSYFALTSTGTSGSMKNLTQGDFLNHFMPLPDLVEQNVITEYLSRETAKLDALVAEAEGAVDLLKERRSALITAAVTGKIDVEAACAVK